MKSHVPAALAALAVGLAAVSAPAAAEGVRVPDSMVTSVKTVKRVTHKRVVTKKVVRRHTTTTHSTANRSTASKSDAAASQ